MMLTADERAEMEKAHDVAFQTDPSLNADVQAIQEKVQALQNKIKAAMIKADPKTAAIFAKLEAAQPPPGSAKPGGN